MKTTVEPHNDYFSTQFLLSFTSAGLHDVLIKTALVDTFDALCDYGQSSLKIKVL
jgi:integrator complex subunit 7